MAFQNKHRKGGLLPLSAALLCTSLCAGHFASAQETSQADDLAPIVRSLAASDPELVRLRKLQDYLKTQPDDLRTTVWTAQKFVAKGKEENDGRYFGYAEALIAPWMATKDVHLAVTLIMADILQYRHAFDAALELLVGPQPRSREGVAAILMRANLRQIQGTFATAKQDCRLLMQDVKTMADICELSLSSLTGELDPSQEKLTELLRRTQLPSEIKIWAVGKLADMLVRQGRPLEALTYLQEASIAGSSSAMQVQLQDLLLYLERPAEVLKLISVDVKSDGLQLRRLRALKMMGQNWRGPTSKKLLQSIAGTPGDTANPHARELAYFHLYLTEDASSAYQAALANWQQQKEPIDTRLLIETAYKAEKLDEVGEAITWIVENRYQDMGLAAFLQAGRSDGKVSS